MNLNRYAALVVVLALVGAACGSDDAVDSEAAGSSAPQPTSAQSSSPTNSDTPLSATKPTPAAQVGRSPTGAAAPNV